MTLNHIRESHVEVEFSKPLCHFMWLVKLRQKCVIGCSLLKDGGPFSVSWTLPHLWVPLAMLAVSLTACSPVEGPVPTSIDKETSIFTLEAPPLPTSTLTVAPTKTPLPEPMSSIPSVGPTVTSAPVWLPTPVPSPTVEILVVSYDEEEIKRQQKAVDEGHFPHRFSDPIHTALDYVDVHHGLGTPEKARILRQKDNIMAVVEFESEGKVYVVTLKKLARHDRTGAWFVTRIEITCQTECQ